MTTFANHGRSAGRLRQVVKCSRISLAVRLLPQPQPHGIATPGGRPPACLAFRSAWRAFCSLSDLLETCIRSRMGLSRLHCFSARESLKRPIPIQLGRAIGTRPGIAAMGATDALPQSKTLTPRQGVLAVMMLRRWYERVSIGLCEVHFAFHV